MRLVAVLSLLAIAFTACERTAPAAEPTPQTTSARTVSASKVAKIAFIDKEHACECTRKRTEGTWSALQSALGAASSPKVERIHVDTETDRARAYMALKQLMVLPGIYFVDANGTLIEALQGEVTSGQISAVLQR